MDTVFIGMASTLNLDCNVLVRARAILYYLLVSIEHEVTFIEGVVDEVSLVD